MQLTKIRIRNYRLLNDAELDIDKQTTLIVGRNNTAKTSCMHCISNILHGRGFTYDDYPLSKREKLHNSIACYMKKEISYAELCKRIDPISVEFSVDYSLDNADMVLGALSPFIIDVDIDTTMALIRVEYSLNVDEKSLWNRFDPCFYKAGIYSHDKEGAEQVLRDNFSKLFQMIIYAVNPKNPEDRQIKSQRELSELFPLYLIPAERGLGEDDAQNNNSLGALITSFFNVKEDELDPSVAEEIVSLRRIIADANRDVQKKSDTILSKVVNDAVGFGYPNAEELQLAVTTQLSIDDQIKNQTKLAYTSEGANESLPSSHNGLGYKNLIKIEFLLAAFAKQIEQSGTASIPLLFIEEPESHMHPQMQHAFADYLEDFLGKISMTHIQTVLTSHSAHIANTVEFSKIRYAQKTRNGVIFKNLQSFSATNDNINFIRKYLTISRCDLFFADKVILVEGASERLLLPDMIDKCDKNGLFNSQKYKLPAQYYALIEVGGAYAHIFIPFMDFLGIPCLILTDLDSVLNRKAVPVSKGDTTSNATIKWWMRRIKRLRENDKSKIRLADICSLIADDKTNGKCHIEFQTEEAGLCGHSLEEAIRNVNRAYYGLNGSIAEEDLEFTGKSKTDFALDLIYKCPNYQIPQYIKDGLVWLNEQKVLT